MACLDMFNSEHQGFCAPVSPRISFSNDFVDAQQMIKYERSSREAPPSSSSDFEFSVSNYSMMTADELFFKGRLLPFKDNCTNQQLQKMTLREELLIDDDDAPPRPPKASNKWKGLLGLKRTHILSKKTDKNDGSMERVVEGKGSSTVAHEQGHVTKTSLVISTDGGPSCRE
ncbi:PREDICTED: uncharacterized protein LOC104601800 [Nelumbo nucifera]|uniref:Membrane-associated kinase regulator 1 n=2 Tax=Nelumbo nucifera TaxID=4432 RepID=A0A822XR00_NELNU|nr:PREDICTED: uncharacterized protein LOC104601800 [Nelumbo nucifera]DAD21581.1 TPA_asm: hypothetical protein HUJ06_023044 [Nelumbo nucifera]